jgi:hypothetical protein
MKLEWFRSLLLVFAMLAVAGVSVVAAADSITPAAVGGTSSSLSEEPSMHGFNSYASFSGFVAGTGSLLKLDSSVGYDFNRNLGIYIGAPIYFSNSFGSGSGSTHLAGLGDAYAGAEVYMFPKLFEYSSSITVGLPTGNVSKGLGAGGITADWTNTFSRSFGKLTPSVSTGIANTVGVAFGSLPASEMAGTSLAARGTFVHFEEGANFDLTQRVYVGAEGYHIVPLSTGRSVNAAGSTGGTVTGILPENGVDVWLGFLPNAYMSTELGYSRSMTFAENSVSWRVGLNLRRMFRNRQQH